MTAPIQGGLGLAPSAEVGDKYGMFRPVHGSAPKYRGKYVANPIATILSAKMLMDWLADKHKDKSAKEAANRIEKAVDSTLKEGKVLPQDLGGSSKTNDLVTSSQKDSDSLETPQQGILMRRTCP